MHSLFPIITSFHSKSRDLLLYLNTHLKKRDIFPLGPHPGKLGLILLLLAAGPSVRLFASEEKKSVSLNLFSNYNHQWLTVNDASLWNPNALFPLPANEARLYLNPEGRYASGNIKFTLSPYLVVRRDWKKETGLREVRATWASGRFEWTIGKVLMKLGTGYMFTPISVFTPAKALDDPEDSLRGQEGVTMVKADYYRENWSLSAIVFKKNTWRNAALFAYSSWKGIDLYGLLYYPEYRKIEAGLALAASAGPGLEVHGEVMFRRRSPLLFHRIYGETNPRISYDYWPLYQPADRVFPEILAGINFSFQGVSLMAEYSHRSWGLTPKAWANLKTHFTYNLQKAGDGRISTDLNAGLQVVQTGRSGLMRDYLFVRAAGNFGRTDVSGIVFVNFADRSLMAVADLNIGLADGLAFFIRPIFFLGKNGAEFAESFYSGIIQVGLTANL